MISKDFKWYVTYSEHDMCCKTSALQPFCSGEQEQLDRLESLAKENAVLKAGHGQGIG